MARAAKRAFLVQLKSSKYVCSYYKKQRGPANPLGYVESNPLTTPKLTSTNYAMLPISQNMLPLTTEKKNATENLEWKFGSAYPHLLQE